MRRFTRIILFAALVGLTAGCRQEIITRDDGDDVIAEGVIFSVEYELQDGKTGGFTRANVADAVPGGNGSWNVDAYGKLTDDYLVITRPRQKDLGPRYIPTRRLVDLTFYEGNLPIDEDGPQ